MTAKLHVIQGDNERRMDACGVCIFSRNPYGIMKCDAFAGDWAVTVRERYPLKCPGYVQEPAPLARTTKPGWLLRFLRWVW